MRGGANSGRMAAPTSRPAARGRPRRETRSEKRHKLDSSSRILVSVTRRVIERMRQPGGHPPSAASRDNETYLGTLHEPYSREDASVRRCARECSKSTTFQVCPFFTKQET